MEEAALATGLAYLGQLSLDPDSVGPDDTLALQDRFRKEIEPLAGFVARLPAGRQPFRPDCQHCDHICDGNCKG
jgi:hypothetical protein